MRVQFVPEKARLSLQNPENLILVENNDDGVVIHAARDNLSDCGKACFIRYLAAEGFISDEFEGFGKSGSRRTTSITWVVEQQRIQRQSTRLERADRFMIRLLTSASALWLALMAFAFLHSAR
jgi:hypothetical protein